MLYILEFGMRLGGHRRDYLPRSFWGWLDLIIIIMGAVSSMSVVIDPVWIGTHECEEVKGNGVVVIVVVVVVVNVFDERSH